MPARNKNEVSVIIPVYNGEKTIRKALEALGKQKGITDLEIIVVDDGSTDYTANIIREFGSVRLIQQRNQGPASARNTGAQQARGSILVFMDADCVPENDFIAEIRKPFREPAIIGAQGAYSPGQRELIARITQLEIEERYRKMKEKKYIDHIGSYAAAYRKEPFIKEGMFDTRFPKASGEDTEFSYRLAERGHKMVFNPKARVRHTHPRTLSEYWKVNFVRGYYRIGVYQRHARKIMDDSYSSRILKMQLAFFFPTLLIALMYAMTLLIPQAMGELQGIEVALGIGVIIVMLPIARFSLNNAARDLNAALAYLIIGLVRVAALSTGIWKGIFHAAVRV